MLDGIGSNLLEEIKATSGDEESMRMIFDNIDFKILVNVILKDHRNSDNHWIAQFMTFDRAPCGSLDDSKQQVKDPDKFENINYLLNKEEIEKLKHDYTILVARVLVEIFPFLEPIRKAIPVHIEHR